MSSVAPSSDSSPTLAPSAPTPSDLNDEHNEIVE